MEPAGTRWIRGPTGAFLAHPAVVYLIGMAAGAFEADAWFTIAALIALGGSAIVVWRLARMRV